ncbi:MAG: probable 3-oxoacyl-(acyl carrier protein) reductase [uncultured Solirubrobacteraceae bacterium]|uniref:Probable 3-oxoacyl-(Acyl carrier protein) reductase n=1 Tax=uncultured Solirubrobacteraceae bacterium TaxID=1162706 RepID=A0A6J4T613_9ACTN|nr:MAG: probable 3-oxoacyl-(acyl carrier protein) reductase [uncultured Solirubrobacteraceae bacterium]
MAATPPWTLSGRTVFVTGAARGIGAEVSRRLAARGARVALVDLEADVLEAVAADCPGAVTFVADVTDPAALQAAVDGTVGELGGIDVVFANAGIAPMGMVRSMDPAAFERTIDINLLGVWRTVHACLPHVIERRGYVLDVASVAAIAHLPGMAAYAATKAGVEAFTNALRGEVRHLGVDVGCAYFSWIDTPMVRGADADPVGAAMRGKLKGPMARTYTVAEAAEAVVEGIEHRSPRVLTPAWLRAFFPLRHAVQKLTDLQARAIAPEADRLFAEQIDRRGAAAASAPVGEGGAAAMAGRAE